MRRNPKQSKNTLAKRIDAQPTVSLQFEVAKFGRALTPAERKDWIYLCTSVPGNLNPKRLRQLADLIEMAESGNGGTDADLLALKGVLLQCKAKMPLSRVAKILGMPQTADGNSSLRRKCKRIGFPLRPGS